MDEDENFTYDESKQKQVIESEAKDTIISSKFQYAMLLKWWHYDYEFDKFVVLKLVVQIEHTSF